MKSAGQEGPPIASRIVDAAIAWYVRRASGGMTVDEEANLDRWLAQHPDHARAWQRLTQMSMGLLEGARIEEATLARSILGRLPALERRKALRLLSWAALGGSGLWLGSGLLGELAFLADYHSATGERREIRLADGSLLQLNSDSAVDVRFDNRLRRIRLRHGEIQLSTAADPAGRPLWVESRDGRLVPVGTRFTVSQLKHATRLGVNEGAVDVFPAGREHVQRIPAGRQLLFGPGLEAPSETLDESRQAWVAGMLSAENRRLDDLLDELARHRSGHLGCTPEAGALRITGTWPLQGEDPSDAVLASLERRLPIRIQRMTRYWVQLRTR